MEKSFSNEVNAVVQRTIAFAGKRHYGAVGREHLLVPFAEGSGGPIIRAAFERCGLSAGVLTKAIEYIDGPQRPHRSGSPVKYIHKDRTIAEPFTQGFTALLTRRIFPALTPNTDEVFQMARREATGEEVVVEELFRILLRELGRGEDTRRVMQVLDHAAPGTKIEDIKSAMIEALDAEIDVQETLHGKTAIVDMRGISYGQEELVRLKRVRHSFMYTGRLQGA